MHTRQFFRWTISAAAFIILMAVLITRQLTLEAVPDFAKIVDPHQRKQLFFDFMRPIIEVENSRIIQQRHRLLKLHQIYMEGSGFYFWELRWLKKTCQEYKVDCTDLKSADSWEKLFRRIGQIPVRLALAQSASESAWGTSRFAVSGKAMFGQWTYSESNGMIPEKRSPEARHRVAEYSSVQDSVRSYINNLNTHSAYSDFRTVRQQLRQQGIKPDGFTLANELVQYSERRQAYVKHIRNIIKTNFQLMGIQ